MEHHKQAISKIATSVRRFFELK
jgi:Delta24-sterol reductase